MTSVLKVCKGCGNVCVPEIDGKFHGKCSVCGGREFYEVK